jgi:hypothetical protein
MRPALLRSTGMRWHGTSDRDLESGGSWRWPSVSSRVCSAITAFWSGGSSTTEAAVRKPASVNRPSPLIVRMARRWFSAKRPRSPQPAHRAK